MRTLVIVNPRSGRRRGADGLAQVRAVLERRLRSVELLCTERPGHAIDIARAATTEGRGLIVAVGGDGTLHEVTNGIVDGGGGAALGYVGVGFPANARHPAPARRLPGDHRQRARPAHRRRLAALPHGQRLARIALFVSVASAGTGGLVDRYVASTPRSFGASAAYFLASAPVLVACEGGRLRCGVTLGDELHERRIETFIIAICNGRYFGGGMHVAPAAKPDDGRFEVMSMDAPSKLAFACTHWRIYDGVTCPPRASSTSGAIASRWSWRTSTPARSFSVPRALTVRAAASPA